MTVIINGTDNSASTPAVTGTDGDTGMFYPAANTVALSTGGSERMRVDSSGYVGIGQASPANWLDISANTSASVGHISLNTTSVSQAIRQIFRESGTAVAQMAWSVDGNALELIAQKASSQMLFYTGSTERARITSGGYFKASNNGTYNNVVGSFHEFFQTSNNEALRVTNANASFSNDVFQVWADRNTTNNSFYVINYYNSAATAYKFRVADSGNVTNTNNSYGSLSDVKLKQDIVDAGSQWDDIKNLRVRKYHWKSDPDGFMQMGLVAQEAELVSPGLIEEHPDYEEVEVPVLDDDGNPVLNEDGTPQVTKERNALGTTTKAVKYSVLYMKAVKALQEAMERIETLEAKVAALEGAE